MAFPITDTGSRGGWSSGGLAAVACLKRGLDKVITSREYLDSINYFPLPDHDTGVNLYQTLAPLREMLLTAAFPRADRLAEVSLRTVKSNMRGCSGLAMAALFDSLARSVAGRARFSPRVLSKALDDFPAVLGEYFEIPAEGTILTVGRRMGERAVRLLDHHDHGSPSRNTIRLTEASRFIVEIVEAGRAGLAETVGVNPTGGEPRVPDAGGAALVLLLEGILEGLRDLERASPGTLRIRKTRITVGVELPETGGVAPTPGAAHLRIVTDSSADLPQHVLEREKIKVVPLQINIGDRTYRDRIDIFPSDFYQRLKLMTKVPTTSLPPVADFIKTFSETARDAREIISINLASKLSGTFQAAQRAAAGFKDIKITVLDSGSISLGLGLLVKQAAEMAGNGKSAEEITERINSLAQRLRILFTVDTLEYLHRGGRIGAGKKYLGSILHLKPILGITQGRIEALGRVFGKRRLLDAIIERIKRSAPRPFSEPAAVVHAGCPQIAQKVAERLQREFDPPEILIGELGAIVGTHGGPGAWGVCYFV